MASPSQTVAASREGEDYQPRNRGSVNSEGSAHNQQAAGTESQRRYRGNSRAAERSPSAPTAPATEASAPAAPATQAPAAPATQAPAPAAPATQAPAPAAPASQAPAPAAPATQAPAPAAPATQAPAAAQAPAPVGESGNDSGIVIPVAQPATGTPASTTAAGEAPAGTVTVATPTQQPTTTTQEGATTGKVVVFNAPFSDTSQWSTNSTAYPVDTSGGHLSDGKLDHVSAQHSRPAGNVFSATKNGNVWNTDLVTTENSQGSFMVRTGDTVRASVTVYDQQGVWPAIWTWKLGQPGSGEVDMFEYHSTSPNLLEVANQTNKTGNWYAWLQDVVRPGVPFVIEMDLKESGVEWRVDGKPVFTGSGVAPDYAAHLIVSMSVASGSEWPHKAPTPDATHLTGMTVGSLEVLR